MKTKEFNIKSVMRWKKKDQKKKKKEANISRERIDESGSQQSFKTVKVSIDLFSYNGCHYIFFQVHRNSNRQV